MTTVERALNSIGKKCFIDYYEDFKNCNDKEVLARKLLANNSNATSITAQMTRINYARWIFDNHKEKEALNVRPAKGIVFNRWKSCSFKVLTIPTIASLGL